MRDLNPWLSCFLASMVFIASRVSTADEPQQPAWWPNAKPYAAEPRPSDGRNMALTIEKLTGKRPLDRPLQIWAIGSSYTNFQGDGSELIALIRERFPNAPEIQYTKHVGSGTPYLYLLGWARHLVTPEQPDVVIIYAVGKAADLERVICEIRANTTADILVPTIHWRRQRDYLWGQREDPVDQEVELMRALCAKYGVEFVENREEMTRFMKANNLRPNDMTFDSVHQNGFTRKINNMNFSRHFHVPDKYAYDPTTRERRISATSAAVKAQGFQSAGDALTATDKGATVELAFTGARIDLIGTAQPDGGSAQVMIDGKPLSDWPLYRATYLKADEGNSNRGNDHAPHGVLLGINIVPQKWTITMVGADGAGDFELVGSVIGADGRGNASREFVSKSGQIRTQPIEWRLAEQLKSGDKFMFEVVHTSPSEVNFRADERKPVRHRLAWGLPNGAHTLKVTANGDGPVSISAFEVYEPPLKAEVKK